jgi:hypothetical protein
MSKNTIKSKKFTAVPDISKSSVELITEIIHLEDAIIDSDQLKALDSLRHKIADLSHDSMVKAFETDAAALGKATEALKAATAAAKDAQDDIDKVAEFVKKAAQAIKLVTQIVGMVGGV